MNPFRNNAQLQCKPHLLVFCACNRNLVCASKDIIVTFLETVFCPLCYVKFFIVRTNPFCRCAFLTIFCSFRKLSLYSRVRCWNRDLYIWWGKIGVSLSSFLVLTINHVPIVEAFSFDGLTLAPRAYIWKVMDTSKRWVHTCTFGKVRGSLHT